jgi:hypothetical protein
MQHLTEGNVMGARINRNMHTGQTNLQATGMGSQIPSAKLEVEVLLFTYPSIIQLPAIRHKFHRTASHSYQRRESYFRHETIS